ncbi:EFR1 family ferrodoxin [Desulfosporosinus fructosivorans]
MQYSSMVIYFMSGTGNSYRAATWMAEIADKKGITSKLYQISNYCEKSDLEEEKDLLGVVFPTHGFTAPWQVIRYTLHLPPGRGKHAFVVATRAGTRIASIPFPGLEGTAGYLIALLLIMKGYIVRGVMGVDMPSNWMSLHWGLNLANSKFIIARAKVKADSFMASIMEGKRMFRGILSLLLGLFLSPISLGYLIIGRFFFSKLFFASASCTGCGLCAESCPLKAIRMTGRNKPRPYWTFSCESCMRCMGYCPNKAVESSHSFAIVLYLVATIPVSLYVLNRLNEVIIIEHYSFFFKIMFDYIYTLSSFFAAYLIFSWLMRIPLLNKLCTYTTFTHLYRRYHEPDTALKDIMMESKKD